MNLLTQQKKVARHKPVFLSAWIWVGLDVRTSGHFPFTRSSNESILIESRYLTSFLRPQHELESITADARHHRYPSLCSVFAVFPVGAQRISFFAYLAEANKIISTNPSRTNRMRTTEGKTPRGYSATKTLATCWMREVSGLIEFMS